MNQRYHHGSLRSALIDAAEFVLERDGIEALTLRAVARQAGVSHAAPTHHFGDLTGLLTELAASGFVRFREHMLKEAETKTRSEPRQRLLALGRGYIGFARTYPGLFLLMFRSERLDWSSPSLYAAGQAAFALLNATDANPANPNAEDAFESLVIATTRWSLMHGLATLLIDGRLEPTSEKVPGTNMNELIEQIMLRSLH